MNSRKFGLAIIVMLSAAFVVYSCGNDNDPMSPYNPEIINNTNNFEFQITAAQNLDHAENYVWQNNGSQATINQSCSISAGRATIILADSTGAILYTGNLADNGTFESAAGVAGPWTIRVEFVNLDGTVNFRTQRR